MKGMQHAKEILGKSFYTFKFDNMIWMTNNNMPSNHKPTTDDISTTKSHSNGNGNSNGDQKAHTPVAAQVPSLGAPISPNGAKVHTPVAAQVPSFGASISPNGAKVHTPVAAKVPSLGATINLDGHE
jgi:hypothetical protein